MAKESGLGMTVAVDDSSAVAKTISNDITNIDFATPRGVQDVTGLNSSAMERILLLADFSVNITGVFNDATDFSHDVFSTVPSSSVARTVTITHSAQVLAGELLFSDYALTRAASGELTYTAPGVLSDGSVPTWA